MDHEPQESENAEIVDIAVLEAAKENIQPLASGRRVTTLSSLFATPHGRQKARLAETRKRLRHDVDVALGLVVVDPDDEDCLDELRPDPLTAFVTLINWTIEHYPQGHSAESGILELLEMATRVLKDDKDCRDDLRYLKLWVLYASYVDRPEVIYKYLLANDIGTSWALLYEECADVYERSARRTQADEMYLLGIARKAESLEHLKNSHHDFQLRMMTAATAPQPAPQPAAPPKRAALAPAPSATRPSGPQSLRGNDDVFAGPSTLPSTATSQPKSKTKTNSKMPVFLDPTGDEGDDSNAATPWPELGTQKSRTKENTRETSVAQGTRLKQSIKKHSGAKSIPVFRDPEPEPVLKRGKAGLVAAKAQVERQGLVIFRDEEPDDVQPRTAPPVKSKPNPKSIAVFCDEEEAAPKREVPMTPTFKPYCDSETVPMSPSSSGNDHSGAQGVMKSKIGADGSEAEALRKDPFKNYTREERPTVP